MVSRKNLKVDADFSSFLRRIQKDDDDGSFCQTTMHLRRREGKEDRRKVYTHQKSAGKVMTASAS